MIWVGGEHGDIGRNIVKVRDETSGKRKTEEDCNKFFMIKETIAKRLGQAEKAA